MKKTIGLAVLLLTGMTAFAQPAAAFERFTGRKEVVVVSHHKRPRIHRQVRIVHNDRFRR
jgi:hypothetical protein